MRFPPRGSVLKRWLLSYLVILLMPCFGAAANYFYTRNTIRQEVQVSNRVTLSGLMTAVDDRLAQMVYTAESLLTSEQLIDTVAAQREPIKFRSLVTELVKNVHSYQRPMENAEMLVYLPLNDYLVTRETGNTLENLEQSVRLVKKRNVTEFFPTIQEPDFAGHFLMSDQHSYTHYGENRIVYLLSRYVNNRLNLDSGYATVLISLPVEDVISQLEDSLMLVFDADGQPLYQTSAEALPLHQPDEDGTLSYDIGGQTYLGYAMPSAKSGWTFVLLSPESRFWKSSNYLTTISLTSLGLSVLMGLLLTFVLLRANYRPLKDTITTMSPTAIPGGRDEYDIIYHTYSTVMSQRNDAYRKMAAQRDIMLDNYLFSHLHGAREPLPHGDIQAFLQLNFTDKAFVLLSFAVSDETERQTAAAAIDSLVARTLMNRYTGYRVRHDELYTWMMVLDKSQTEEFTEDAGDKLGGMLRQLQETLHGTVSILVSDVLYAFEELPRAYREIRDHQAYQYVSGVQGVVRVSMYTQLIMRQRMRDHENDELDLLCDAISARRTQDACAVLKRMFDHLFSEGGGWPQRLRACGWMGMLLASDGIDASDEELGDVLHALHRCGTLEECYKHSIQLTQLLCGEKQPRHETGSSLSQKVQAYIDEHYADPNLSLSSLGDVFELSPKYLSRLYKSETDASLLEYLNTVRVNRAMELLKAGNHTVASVATMVGYTNVKTFRRAFSRITERSPSQAGETE